MITYGRPVLKIKEVPPQPLNSAEKRLAAIFTNAVKKMIGPNVALYDTALRRNIERGDVDGILNSVNWTEFISSFEPLQGELAKQIALRATSYSKQIGLHTSFSATDPHIVEAARTQVAHLVTGVTANTRETIRRLVTTAVASQQLTVDDVAHILRNVVGPTRRSAQAIQNGIAKEYSRLVQAGVPHAEAQRRARAHGARMHQRAVRSRAVTIARTEILRANNAGRYASWQDAAARGVVTPSHRKEWVATTTASRYGPPCDICQPLNGTLVAWDANFPGGYSMPPAHPRCRCTATLRGPEQKMTTEEWLAQQQKPPESAPGARSTASQHAS